MTDVYMKKYARFMPVAWAYAAMSKYPGTKVGALILGPGFEDRASGWNGSPRMCKADEDGRLDVKGDRLTWATHAEANAICNAARSGVSTVGCVMVVTHEPCMDCAKLIVQAGIYAVVTNFPDEDFGEKWKASLENSRALFDECKVMRIYV